MKAVVLTEPKNLELLEIPTPELTEENHVLIKVKACGICGSDLRYWAGDNPWALHTLGRHIDNPPNMVMGHEFAGEVVKVNSPDDAHLLGQRVGVQSFRVCGKCDFCTSGRENLCRDMIHIGHAQGWGKMDYFPGAYAEYCLGWADLLHPIPDKLSYAEAALSDILCVAVHVVDRTSIHKGASVLCIGGGPAGLSIAQLAQIRGAKNIIISEPAPLARKVLEAYPQFTVINPNVDDVAQVVESISGGDGLAAIFDSVGKAETIEMGLPLLAESGTYVNLAVHDEPIQLNAMSLGSERSFTTSSNAFYRDLSEGFELLNKGHLDVKPWITHRFPLEDYQKAFDLLLQNPKAAYKVVFEP
jgi:2-desacetyl-2-hydroxyethyl bacteriochlorophyllide A dehydrogenase